MAIRIAQMHPVARATRRSRCNGIGVADCTVEPGSCRLASSKQPVFCSSQSPRGGKCLSSSGRRRHPTPRPRAPREQLPFEEGKRPQSTPSLSTVFHVGFAAPIHLEAFTSWSDPSLQRIGSCYDHELSLSPGTNGPLTWGQASLSCQRTMRELSGSSAGILLVATVLGCSLAAFALPLSCGTTCTPEENRLILLPGCRLRPHPGSATLTGSRPIRETKPRRLAKPRRFHPIRQSINDKTSHIDDKPR